MNNYAPIQQNKRQVKNSLFIYIIVILILLSFGIGIYVGRLTLASSTNRGAELVNKNGRVIEEVDFSLYWKVMDMLEEKHISKPLDIKKLFYGSIAGMVNAVGDPYSSFFDPEKTAEFEKELESNFEGIGIEIAKKNDKIVVVSPLDGTPAEKAGLKPGDWIVKINDELTLEMPLDTAVSKIRGQKDTNVKLSISREGNEELTDFNINRTTINVKTVKLEYRNDIAILEINSFSSNTVREFDSAVQQISKDKPKGIILDLRNNPGGLLDASVHTSSTFVDKGTIVTEKYSDGREEKYEATGKPVLKDFPLVILTNEGSASASEIMAGALRDLKGTKLIGKKTYGKGSVQDYNELPQKTSLKITVAKWLTPNGHEIEGKGLVPDIEVDLTNENFDNDQDPQIDKALEEILK